MSSTDEQDSRTTGSVPVAYGNALTWRWPREMSPYLRRSGLVLLLCQLRNFATASGEVAFNSDRKPIRITDIATAACCREKDARRYLEAAGRAGVVRVMGERKRGKATRYVIVPHPRPDWQAAEDYLKSTARDSSKRPPKWAAEAETTDESSGHSGPYEFGPLRPDVTDGTAEEVRATPARMSSGRSGPTGSGHSGPNNPGGYPGFSQDGAEVVPQPQAVGASGPQDHISPQEPDSPSSWTRCAVCRRPILPDPHRPGRTVHARCETPVTATRAERHSA